MRLHLYTSLLQLCTGWGGSKWDIFISPSAKIAMVENLLKLMFLEHRTSNSHLCLPNWILLSLAGTGPIRCTLRPRSTSASCQPFGQPLGPDGPVHWTQGSMIFNPKGRELPFPCRRFDAQGPNVRCARPPRPSVLSLRPRFGAPPDRFCALESSNLSPFSWILLPFTLANFEHLHMTQINMIRV